MHTHAGRPAKTRDHRVQMNSNTSTNTNTNTNTNSSNSNNSSNNNYYYSNSNDNSNNENNDNSNNDSTAVPRDGRVRRALRDEWPEWQNTHIAITSVSTIAIVIMITITINITIIMNHTTTLAACQVLRSISGFGYSFANCSFRKSEGVQKGLITDRVAHPLPAPALVGGGKQVGSWQTCHILPSSHLLQNEQQTTNDAPPSEIGWGLFSNCFYRLGREATISQNWLKGVPRRWSMILHTRLEHVRMSFLVGYVERDAPVGV